MITTVAARGAARGPLGTFAPWRARSRLLRCWVEAGADRRGTPVKAQVGDKIVVEGHHLGEPRRDAVVLDVRGADGEPPYLVRWDADGHEGLFFPGSDASVVHVPHSGPG